MKGKRYAEAKIAFALWQAESRTPPVATGWRCQMLLGDAQDPQYMR